MVRSIGSHQPGEGSGREPGLLTLQGGDQSDTTLDDAFFVAFLVAAAWLAWWSGAVAWWLATGRGHGGRLIAGTTSLGLWRLDRASRANQ